MILSRKLAIVLAVTFVPADPIFKVTGFNDLIVFIIFLIHGKICNICHREPVELE